MQIQMSMLQFHKCRNNISFLSTKYYLYKHNFFNTNDHVGYLEIHFSSHKKAAGVEYYY